MIEARIIPDFSEWRDMARGLLAHHTPPEQIYWCEEADNTLAFASPHALPMAERGPRRENAGSNDVFRSEIESAASQTPDRSTDRPATEDRRVVMESIRDTESAEASPFRVPREFLSACRLVSCHRDASRWSLMYRVLWRLAHNEPDLLELIVDPDVHQLMLLEKAVRRDRHKMTAFVRFRKVVDDAGEERYVAWHRPDHLIVRLTAPFFAERFAAMHWAILTPDESVAWDGNKLQFGPGVPKSSAPAGDELESLWKTYYGSIFNPARINTKQMRKEMPVRHWATLPESEIISDLLEDAPRRMKEMARQSKAAEQPETSADKLTVGLTSLSQLRTAAKTCQACPLYCHATQTVFGEGPAHAKLVFVGEQPGDEEDLSGHPFVGPAGRLLNEMLQEAGVDRSAAYVTNAVKHFKFEPRGKRRMHKTPSAREVTACTPWLNAELSIIRPAKLVCLGATAARAVFGRDFKLTADRGKPRETQWSPWTMATWHPSALLRIPDPDQRAQWRQQFADDLRKIAAL